MARQKRFTIDFLPRALEHLDSIDAKHRSEIQKAMQEQLVVTPNEVTRNRKPLQHPGPFEATWELRCGTDNRFRIFFDIDDVESIVHVQAIGLKVREKLY